MYSYDGCNRLGFLIQTSKRKNNSKFPYLYFIVTLLYFTISHLSNSRKQFTPMSINSLIKKKTHKNTHCKIDCSSTPVFFACICAVLLCQCVFCTHRHWCTILKWWPQRELQVLCRVCILNPMISGFPTSSLKSLLVYPGLKRWAHAPLSPLSCSCLLRGGWEGDAFCCRETTHSS